MNKIFGSLAGVVLITIIPIVFYWWAMISINNDHNCIVQHIPAAYGKQSGYAEQPAEVQVEASPSVRWNDMGRHNVILILFAHLVILLGSAVAYFKSEDFQKAWGPIIIIGASWIIAAVMIFSSYWAQSDSEYVKKVPETIWSEKWKDDCGELFTSPDYQQYK